MEGSDSGGEIDRKRLDSTTEGSSVRKRKIEIEDQVIEEEEEVIRACVIEGSKHADGSIYRQDTHFCHSLYRLDDTRETAMKPTIFLCPDTNKECIQDGCAMMQIFSLNLANHSVDAALAGPIMLYGFMAVRDLLHPHPLRNYVFNRTRDNPLVLHRSPDDPSSPMYIQMTGPKRGIYLQARALIEYDVRIKKATEAEDLQLIDGAATFSDLTAFHGTYTQRIHGDHGGAAAVDITLALLRDAVEAKIEICMTKVPAAGLSLSLSCYVSRIKHEIKLFDGIVDKPGNIKRGSDLKSFVVAVVYKSPLTLSFKVGDTQNSTSKTHMRGYPAKGDGRNWDWIPLGDFGEIEVHIFWSNL